MDRRRVLPAGTFVLVVLSALGAAHAQRTSQPSTQAAQAAATSIVWEIEVTSSAETGRRIYTLPSSGEWDIPQPFGPFACKVTSPQAMAGGRAGRSAERSIRCTRTGTPAGETITGASTSCHVDSESRDAHTLNITYGGSNGRETVMDFTLTCRSF